jgi:hypothetical protein
MSNTWNQLSAVQVWQNEQEWFRSIVVHQVHRSLHPVGSCIFCFKCSSCLLLMWILPASSSPDCSESSWWHHGDIMVTSWHAFNRPPWPPWLVTLVLFTGRFHRPATWSASLAVDFWSPLSQLRLWWRARLLGGVVARAGNVTSFGVSIFGGMAAFCPEQLHILSMQNCSEWHKICRLVKWFHMFHGFLKHFTNAMGCNLR